MSLLPNTLCLRVCLRNYPPDTLFYKSAPERAIISASKAAIPKRATAQASHQASHSNVRRQENTSSYLVPEYVWGAP